MGEPFPAAAGIRHRHVCDPFTRSELIELCGPSAKIRRLLPGQQLCAPDDNSGHILGIVEGWAFSYRLFDDGRRQIMKIELPGGLIGLSSTILDETAWGCEALTEIRYCAVPREIFLHQAYHQPGLALRIAAEAVRGEVLLRERLGDVARRPARERIANFLFELCCRCQGADEGERASQTVTVPLTQCQIADAVGLTPIHVSRTLRAFKQSGILRYSGRQLQIVQPHLLSRCSSLEPDYARWLRNPMIAATPRRAEPARGGEATPAVIAKGGRAPARRATMPA